MGFADRAAEVVRFRAAEVEVRGESGSTLAQFDGDPAGTCPVRIAVVPSSMTLVVRSNTQ